MHRAHARTASALLTGLVIAGVAACGWADPPAEQPPRNAAAHFAPDQRASAEPLLKDVVGKIDHAGSTRSSVQGKLGMAGDLIGEGLVHYTGNSADVTVTGYTQMAPSQRRVPTELSLVGNIGYLKSPLLRPQPGKPWLMVDPGGTDFAAKLLAPAMEQLRDSIDPRKAFFGIEHATKIQSRAADTVDGRPTTRYDLRVLTAEAAKLATDPQQRERLRRAADAGQPELGYQLWVDQSGLPARFSATKSVAQAGQVSLDSTYRDWGVPAEIQAPAADMIGEFQDMPVPHGQQPPR